jgi:hypothetical protein
MKNIFQNNSNHFRQFALELEDVLGSYTKDSDHQTMQRRRVEALCNLETEWRNALIRDGRGPAVYKAFVKLVRDERRNILDARPFFRERQDVFKNQIAPALRDRADKKLYMFNINYSFIVFAMKAKHFSPRSKVGKLAKAVEEARRELIEVNLPMAISRARAFAFYKQAHLEYMDLVQVATEGVIAAVDKYVLPYTSVFGAVLYGRATGDLVEGNSETLIHFWPKDKRRIYTANKLVKEGKSFEEIADRINDKAATSADKTTAQEIQQLHAAAYVISGETLVQTQDNEEIDESPMARFEAPADTRPDTRYEEAEIRHKLQAEIRKLSLFERKLLAMKGIELP